MKKFILAGCFLVLTSICAALVYGNAPGAGAYFTYSLNPSLQWEESDLDTWSDKITNYELSNNKDIVMNFTYFNQDLYSELKTKGEKEVVAGIMRGKNTMFDMIGADNARLTGSRLITAKHFSILEMTIEYSTNNKTFRLTEKFHIMPRKVLISSFRYTGKNSSLVESARKDFENVVVTVKQ